VVVNTCQSQTKALNPDGNGNCERRDRENDKRTNGDVAQHLLMYLVYLSFLLIYYS